MRVTKAVHYKFSGPKRYRLNAMTTLRGMFEEMADGSRREIEPGDWRVMDDMSVNYPFWFDNPFGSDKLAKAHGVGIGRQSLCAMDLASCKWLGFVLIGRPRDAYRAEDILRFCRRLFQEYGLPRRGLRLERGIWQAKKIQGHEVVTTTSGSEAVVELPGERPEMPEAERNLVIAAPALPDCAAAPFPHGRELRRGRAVLARGPRLVAPGRLVSAGRCERLLRAGHPDPLRRVGAGQRELRPLCRRGR
jgi:hypothetical protein